MPLALIGVVLVILVLPPSSSYRAEEIRWRLRTTASACRSRRALIQGIDLAGGHRPRHVALYVSRRHRCRAERAGRTGKSGAAHPGPGRLCAASIWRNSTSISVH